MIDDKYLNDETRKLWNLIPPEAQLKILNNVWCVNCRKGVKITIDKVESSHFSPSPQKTEIDLILRGKCQICDHSIARVIGELEAC